jgi:hypothetical protein
MSEEGREVGEEGARGCVRVFRVCMGEQGVGVAWWADGRDMPGKTEGRQVRWPEGRQRDPCTAAAAAHKGVVSHEGVGCIEAMQKDDGSDGGQVIPAERGGGGGGPP